MVYKYDHFDEDVPCVEHVGVGDEGELPGGETGDLDLGETVQEDKGEGGSNLTANRM